MREIRRGFALLFPDFVEGSSWVISSNKTSISASLLLWDLRLVVDIGRLYSGIWMTQVGTKEAEYMRRLLNQKWQII